MENGLGGAAARLRPYEPGDGDAVVALWNDCGFLGREFPLDLRLWRQNVDHSDWTAWPACLVACDAASGGRVVGVIACKRRRHVSALVVAREHRRRGIGRALVEAAADALAAGGGEGDEGGLIAGADYNHFFPGIPAGAEAALGFFRALGFEVGARPSYDLMRALHDFEIPEAVRERARALRHERGIVIAPCREQDVAALRAHLEASFPGRWTEDTMRRVALEPDPGEIVIARHQSSGAVLGFAHTFSARSAWLGPPIYWRPLLGARPGGLGPIGVAPEARKLGLGLALLAAGVETVRQTGAERMAIDWTDLVEFYGRLGFAPWKEYRSAARPRRVPLP